MARLEYGENNPDHSLDDHVLFRQSLEQRREVRARSDQYKAFWPESCLPFNWGTVERPFDARSDYPDGEPHALP